MTNRKQGYFKDYYSKNKEAYKQYQNKYYSENKEKISKRKKLEYIGRKSNKMFIKVIDEFKKKFLLTEKTD